MQPSKKNLIRIILLCSFISQASSVCYPAPTYQSSATKYTCALRQANWAREAIFEITYLHCRKEPAIHVFVRNFYGLDEINRDFSQMLSNVKATSFSGKTSMLAFKFSTFEAIPKYGVRKQTQVKVVFTGVFGKPNSEHLLTAVFPADDTSDCSWGSSMELHDQIFLGGGICLALIFILFVVYLIRKYKNNHGTMRPDQKVFL